MSPERWRRVAEVYDLAVEQGPRAEEFLDRIGKRDGDAEICSEVRRMLLERTADLPGSGPHEFPGTERFSVVRRIGAGGMGVVYEVFDHERNERVALKKLSRIDPFLIYQFKREFRSLAEIVHPHLLPIYELFSDSGYWFFTMELLEKPVDFMTYVCGGASLEEAAPEPSQTAMLTETIVRGPAAMEAARTSRTTATPPARRPLRRGVDWDRLRSAFRQLTEGVCALHSHYKLHCDLKPGNVLVRGDGRVTLLDFGLVADLTQPEGNEAFRIGSGSGSTRGHQTSSQYLAGTVAYMSPEQAETRALTAATDWYSVGVMLYRALTGRMPFQGKENAILIDKREIEPPAPAELVDGIPEDLNELCRDLLRRAPDARPGGSEVAARLGAVQGFVPESDELPFVGRQTQLGTLREALARATTGNPVVCHVHGSSGSGKSALVEHFLWDVTGSGEVMVLAGRCYEQESVPYKAVDSVVDALCARLAELPMADVKAWMPDDVQALIRVFPVMKRVLAAPAEAAEPGAGGLRELHSRAIAALGELLSRISKHQTLVIAIDDLQWGDVDSASLLAELLRVPQLRRLLLVAAYRSEYRDVSPCLRAFRELEFTTGSHRSLEVEVGALSDAEADELARSLLERPDSEASRALATRIVRESNGSALFVYELVRHARSGAELAPDSRFELDEILWQRADSLPEPARHLLEVIAVAGRPVRLKDACAAGQMSSAPHHVVSALRAGHFVRTFGRSMNDEIETFHDRVRESVIAHLPSPKLKDYHGRLAAALEESGLAEPETIASHYEGAGDARAAQYYEMAADRAVERLALNRAEDYFRHAVDLAASDLDKARIYEKMIHFYTDVARFDEAYKIGRRGAAMFGIRLPEKFRPPASLVALLFDVARARMRLGFRKPSDLINQPEMADEGLRSAVRLIAAVAKAAYQVRPELCVAISTRAVNLCLAKGNTPDIAIPYMVFGCIFLGGIMRNYRTGFEFGRLAVSLVDKYDNRKQHAEVHFVVGYFAASWLEPATTAERLWETAYTAGLQKNDLFHTGCACAATVQSHYMRGIPLDAIWEESERMLKVLNGAQLRETAGCVHSVRQAIRNLRGLTRSHATFADDGFNEDEFASSVEGYGSRHFAHYYFINKMQVLYLWGDYPAAAAMAARSATYLHDSQGMLHSAEHLFYNALIGAQIGASKKHDLAQARQTFRKWASLCPHNFSHKYGLLCAEEARLNGKYAEAASLYDSAIRSAEEFGYWQIHALANRLAARLARQQGQAESAKSYDASARKSWLRWGASALAESSEVF